MVRKQWLALLGLSGILASMPSFAATNMHQQSLKTCHMSRNVVSELWQSHRFQAPPIAFDVVTAAIDGNVAKTRQALATLPPSEAARWRQLAMYTAATLGKTAVVDALLDDGAKANETALIPAIDPRIYANSAALLKQKMGAKAVNSLQSAGIMNNGPRLGGPSIFATVECNDLPTTKVLLKHGADPMRRDPDHPDSGADPFIVAVFDGNAEVTQALLDHDAKPCLEDRRLAANWQRARRKDHPNTIAGIGAKSGLPQTLVNRLVCRVQPATG